MLKSQTLQSITDKFGQERIDKREQKIKHFLSAFQTKHNLLLSDSIDNSAKFITYKYYELSYYLIYPHLPKESLAHNSKIVALSIYAIMLFEDLFLDNQTSINSPFVKKELNIRFACFLANGFILNDRHLPSSEDFTAHFDTGVAAIDDQINTIIDHHIYYLKNLQFSTNAVTHLPCVLYANFIHAYSIFLKYIKNNPNAISGLRL